MKKRLYRSNSDKMISGVCSGIAEYYDLDATLVRLAFVLFSMAGGGGIIAYIVCAVIIPEKPLGYVTEEDVEVLDKDGKEVKGDSAATQKKTKQFIGVVLLILGGLLLFDNIFWWFDKGVIWSVGIIAVGGFLLLKPSNESKE